MPTIRTYHPTKAKAEDAVALALYRHGDDVIMSSVIPPNDDRATWACLVILTDEPRGAASCDFTGNLSPVSMNAWGYAW